MQFTREIRHLLIALLLGLAAVASSAVYWAAIGSESILSRDDNPRLFIERASVLRGEVYDRDQRLLVASVQNPNGFVSRRFLMPETHGTLGYYSLIYGSGGIESAFEPIIRGDDLPLEWDSYLAQALLRQPQRGSDIRLTLDLDIQQVAYSALEGHTGAVVVLSVPDGEVLSLLSLPAYNPNTLDRDWEQLVQDASNPFFNRALQGQYQPGGALQTVLLTAALIDGVPTSVVLEDVARPVLVDDLRLTCAERPPSRRLTLGESYAFGCPAPFADLYETLTEPRIAEVFGLFAFHQPPALEGFPPPVLPDAISRRLAEITLADALGQGDIVVTPLQMATLTAAFINGGNAPQPFILHSTRAPGATEWTSRRAARPATPITTAETSRRVQSWMREATVSGSARRAARADMSIGGHTALAYSGETTIAWFTGFVITGQNRGVAIAIALEGVDDVTLAAEMGGRILERAYRKQVGDVSDAGDAELPTPHTPG